MVPSGYLINDDLSIPWLRVLGNITDSGIVLELRVVMDVLHVVFGFVSKSFPTEIESTVFLVCSCSMCS